MPRGPRLVRTASATALAAMMLLSRTLRKPHTRTQGGVQLCATLGQRTALVAQGGARRGDMTGRQGTHPFSCARSVVRWLSPMFALQQSGGGACQDTFGTTMSPYYARRGTEVGPLRAGGGVCR